MSINSTLTIMDMGRETEEYRLFYQTARFVTGLLIYPTICAFGLVGNGMGLIVLSQKQMKSSTNVYLFALTVSDCIKLICDALYFLVILFLEIDPKTGNKLYVCLYPYAHYVFNASLCISAWITISVAFERYIYVCHPTKVNTYCSIGRARAICMTVFIAMSLVSIPYAMRYRAIVRFKNESDMPIYYDLQLTDLWINDMFSSIYTWIHYLIRSLVPLVLLIVLSTCIMCGIRRCRLIRAKQRITTIIVLIVIAFLICVIPDAIMSTFLGFGYYEENYMARGIREITDSLLLINTVTNFVIYCIFNTIFWKNFKTLFCSCIISNRHIAEKNKMSQHLLINPRSYVLRKQSQKMVREVSIL